GIACNATWLGRDDHTDILTTDQRAPAGAYRFGADARECQKQTGRGVLSRMAGQQSADTGPGAQHHPPAAGAKSTPMISFSRRSKYRRCMRHGARARWCLRETEGASLRRAPACAGHAGRCGSALALENVQPHHQRPYASETAHRVLQKRFLNYRKDPQLIESFLDEWQVVREKALDGGDDQIYSGLHSGNHHLFSRVFWSVSRDQLWPEKILP
ncbi:MAG: hypothetical protein ACI8S6_004327, partial [Myxococcota bacterium]